MPPCFRIQQPELLYFSSFEFRCFNFQLTQRDVVIRPYGYVHKGKGWIICSGRNHTGATSYFFHNKLAASIAAYQIKLQNVAVNANDISNPNRYIQIGEVESTGIETEIAGNILPNLSMMLSYAYCDAKISKSKDPTQVGMVTENAPKNTSSSWIKYVFAKNAIKGFGIAVGHSQVGLRNTLESGIILPAYFVLNAGLQYSQKHIQVGLNLNNITNEGYWTGGYNNVNKWAGAPRNYMINLGYHI